MSSRPPISPLIALALTLFGVSATTGCSTPPKEIEALSAPDAEERVDAANALAEGVHEGEEDFVESRDRIAVELRKLLDDRSALVRQVAIEALARVEGKGAAGPIADRLRDRDAWVRYTAAKELGALQARTAADALGRALTDRDESDHVRRAAAQALGAIGERSSLRPLYLALDDIPAVRYQAYLALRAITGEDRGEDQRAWRDLIPNDRPE